MKLDQVSKNLLAAARYTERHCIAKAPTLHLLDCVSMSLHRHIHIIRVNHYHNAARVLFDMIGTDLADFSKDEAIDMLVAAAYWECKWRQHA